MSVVVINRLRFKVPVDDLVPQVQAAFAPAFDDCPGFERFELIKVGDSEAIALIHWTDAEAATAGAARVGPTVFREIIGPNLAAEQERVVGPAVVVHPG